MREKWDQNTYQSQHTVVGKKELNADQKTAPVSTRVLDYYKKI